MDATLLGTSHYFLEDFSQTLLPRNSTIDLNLSKKFNSFSRSLLLNINLIQMQAFSKILLETSTLTKVIGTPTLHNILNIYIL